MSSQSARFGKRQSYGMQSHGRHGAPSYKRVSSVQRARGLDYGWMLDPPGMKYPEYTEKEKRKAFFQAILYGFVATLGFQALLMGIEKSFWDVLQRPLDMMLSLPVAFALAGPFGALVRKIIPLVEAIGLRRGVSDVLLGALFGLFFNLESILDAKLPDAQGAAFFLGCVFTGYAFWREQGYPGLTNKTAKQGLETAYRVTR